MASSVTRRTVVSYTAFPPLPQCCQAASGGISLLHYPWSRLHRTLSGILPYEARTFLTCFYKQPRSSVLLAPCYFSTPYLFCQTVHSAPFAKPRFQRSPLLRSSFLLMKWRSLRTFYPILMGIRLTLKVNSCSSRRYLGRSSGPQLLEPMPFRR